VNIGGFRAGFKSFQRQKPGSANAAINPSLPTQNAVTAADNIARGIVHEREQLGQYGAVIVNQARRLTEFVEQVLLFASTRNATHRTVLQPVDISEVIDTTLDASADLLQASRVAVETGIDADLPSVMADPSGRPNAFRISSRTR
jgi:signal transduction histidine kinase